MPTPIPLDSTIAEMAAAGYTHIRTECACGIVATPFALIAGDPKDLTLADLRRRMRCRTCGEHPRPGTGTPWRQSDAQGHT